MQIWEQEGRSVSPSLQNLLLVSSKMETKHWNVAPGCPCCHSCHPTPTALKVTQWNADAEKFYSFMTSLISHGFFLLSIFSCLFRMSNWRIFFFSRSQGARNLGSIVFSFSVITKLHQKEEGIKYEWPNLFQIVWEGLIHLKS